MTNQKNGKERARTQLAEVVMETAKGLRNWRDLSLSIGLGGMLLLLGLTMAVLTNPAAVSANLPLSEEDVGKVATMDVRAPMSFTVPDVEATERKRREAEEAVRSVYDFEQELGTERIRRLKESFAEMARVVEEHGGATRNPPPEDPGEDARKKVPPKKSSRSPRGTADDGPAESATGKTGKTEEAKPPEPLQVFTKGFLDAALDARKDQFVRTLQVVIGESDFARLREDRFSDNTLAAVVNLVDRTMQYMIVPSRELLALERGRGITVRYSKQGTSQREHVVLSFDKILDLEGALLRVEQEAALELSEVPLALRSVEIRLAKNMITPNLGFNRSETEKRKRESQESVQPLEIRIKKGAKIIRDGDLIEKNHIRIFQEMKKLTEVSNATEMAVGTMFLVILMLVITMGFSQRNIRSFLARPMDMLLLGLTLFVFVVTTKIWFWILGAVWDRFQIFPLESYYYAIPLAAGSMLIRFVLNSVMALSFTVVGSVLVGMLIDNSLSMAFYCLVSSLVAAWAVGAAKQRSTLLKAGALTGLGNVAIAAGMGMFIGNFWSFETMFNAIFAFSGGVLSAMIVTASAPVIEAFFGYTTDIKLMELANLNHPLLKDLIVQAPGSYHHSIIVGSLVEAAAEGIGCNPLLARVMAYYHDIGKTKSPTYFSENQRDTTNPHDKLKPSLSATVLKKHVKDGAELAKAAKLGQPIIEAIQQHHGTSLIKFFFQKAKDNEDPQDPVVEEEYRYPGPKPQSREVALVMLADSVEAAAKSITDPSSSRLQGLVQNMINRIFSDGQLNECDLTLRNLNDIARAFNRVLSGIYHHRPDYPEAATKDAGKTKPQEGKPREDGDRRKEGEEPPEDLKRLGM